MHVYLARTSQEMHMNPDVFSLSNMSSYAEIQWWCGDDVVDLPPHIPMRCWAQHLRPDSKVWPCHTYSVWPLSGTPKIPLYCTEYNWPMTCTVELCHDWLGTPLCHCNTPWIPFNATCCWTPYSHRSQKYFNVGDSSEWHLQWISYVDEYSPTLHFVEGPGNVIADTFSCLLCQDDMSAIVEKKAITEDSELAYYSVADDREIFNFLINLPYFSLNEKQE